MTVTADTVAAPPAPRLDPRTQALLHHPVLPTMIRLAWPNVLVMLVQSSTGIIETYFIGRLGTSALAGVSMVFPGVMLMQMMSMGAFGGGISSAIARALGSGRRDDANALLVHALIIGGGMGLIFMTLALLGGPAFYRLLGGEGPSLAAAITYSNVVFAGAVIFWVFAGLSNAIRGTGNMLVPASVTCLGVVILIPLSPCLINGWGPFPRLGVAGGGVAILAYYTIGSIIQATYLLTGRGVLKPSLFGVSLRWPLFRDILKVGAVAALVTLQTNLTVMATTGLIGRFGTAAIAGYGVGSRLEYLLIPLLFGLGAPLLVLVGTNIGAGQRDRAMRIAWTGAAVSFAIAEAIGLAAAHRPLIWLSLFDTDPAMLAAGTAYLQVVGPFYGFFGLGMALYFCAQGAGKVWWPLIAGVCRMLVAVVGGYFLLSWTGQLSAAFYALGAGLVVFGAINAASVASGVWFRSGVVARR